MEDITRILSEKTRREILDFGLVDRIDHLNFALIKCPSDQRLLNERGEEHMKRLDFESAIADFDQVLKRDGRHIIALKNRAKCHLRVSLVTQAFNDAKLCLRLLKTSKGDSKCHVEALLVHGEIQYHRKDFDVAIRDYGDCIRLLNDHIDIEAKTLVANAYVLRGLSFFKKGNLSNSISDILQGIKRNYDFIWHCPTLYNLQTLPSFQKNIFLTMKQCLSEGLKQDPKNSTLYHFRGIVNLRLKDYEESVIDLDEAVKLSPKDSSIIAHRVVGLWGNCEEDEVEYGRILEECERAIKLDSTNDLAWHMKGILLWALRQLKRNCEYLKRNEVVKTIESILFPYYNEYEWECREKALKLNPRRPDTIFRIARGYVNSDDAFPFAVPRFLKLAKLCPSLADLYLWRAWAVSIDWYEDQEDPKFSRDLIVVRDCCQSLKLKTLRKDRAFEMLGEAYWSLGQYRIWYELSMEYYSDSVKQEEHENSRKSTTQRSYYRDCRGQIRRRELFDGLVTLSEEKKMSLEDCLKFFNVALKITPGAADGHLARGIMFENENKIQDAFTDYCCAIKYFHERNYHYEEEIEDNTDAEKRRTKLLYDHPVLLGTHLFSLTRRDECFLFGKKISLLLSNEKKRKKAKVIDEKKEEEEEEEEESSFWSNPIEFFSEVLKLKPDWRVGCYVLASLLEKEKRQPFLSLSTTNDYEEMKKVYALLFQGGTSQETQFVNDCLECATVVAPSWMSEQMSKKVKNEREATKVKLKEVIKGQRSEIEKNKTISQQKDDEIEKILKCIRAEENKIEENNEEMQKLKNQIDKETKRIDNLGNQLQKTMEDSVRFQTMSSFERSLIGLKYRHYEIIEAIGGLNFGKKKKLFGGMSAVFRVKFRGKELAMKVILNLGSTNSSAIRNQHIQSEFLYRIPDHPNICRIHHCFVDSVNTGDFPGWENIDSDIVRSKTAFFIMTLYKKTLRHIFQEKGSKRPFLSVPETRKLISDICSALKILQKYKIIHRDLKDDNIFISKDGKYVLGDFGISLDCIYAENFCIPFVAEGSNKMGGNPYGMPPEVKYLKPGMNSFLKYGKYDIYSLGMVCYSIFKDGYPFGKDVKECHSDKYYRALLLDDCADATLRHLIKSMLRPKYEDRINLEVLIERLGESGGEK